ncbi:hypothetical protein Tco_0733788 [Tanacetum coccineum]
MKQPQPNNNYISQPSFNQNYMKQLMLNPEDILDPTTAMNMALVLMDKAFKLNYSTPTNNNQRISSNLRNRQIAQPGMNLGQDRQMQMIGGIQNVGNQNGLIVVPRISNQNGNGNIIATREKEAGIQLQAEEFDFMAAVGDLNEIEEVNANCILMANLQQASTSGTLTDKAPVYDSDGSAEVHHSENYYDNDIFNMFTQEEHVKQSGRTVEQGPATVKETRAYFKSLYNNLAIEVEKVNTVNRKMKETNADLT